MTSRLAFSYNRDVYALPGRVDDSRSQGCNLLIKGKVAEAIDSVEGLIDSLGLQAVKTGKNLSDKEIISNIFGSKAGSELITKLSDLLKMIRIHRGISLDDLSAMTGSPYSMISRLTGMLEMEGLITIDLLQRCTISPRISR